MTTTEIKTVLANHLSWLCGEPDGEKANLHGANLNGADLHGAYLNGADLHEANLRGANLYRSDLREANLRGANLRGANLYEADLHGANLNGADLYGADLYGADLRGADLYGAYLRGADLHGANLRGVKCQDELLVKFFPICCPETGAFTAYKKVCGGLIVKLEVIADAKRSSAYGRKCRCSAAKVLAIENPDGTPSERTEVSSVLDETFKYKVGEIVSVDNFDTDRSNECGPGIHFFITRREAVDYVL